MYVQLLREFPPGFGGVERVAHCLAAEKGGNIFFLRKAEHVKDPLTVSYRRTWIPSFCIGRIFVPLPSVRIFRLLLSQDILIAHLPCPTVLFLGVLARIFRPKRSIYFYWHSVLHPREGLQGLLELFYQNIAFICLRYFPVIVTSPVIKNSLYLRGIPIERIIQLPCSLPSESEHTYDLLYKERIKERITNDCPRGRIIFMGRLASYKRVDWLIKAFSNTQAAFSLVVVGEGPDRLHLERLAIKIARPNQVVSFYGCVNEVLKLKLLSDADLLVLPADRCNEAFGIVQLEAMASGIPALAFNLPDSGMHWVSKLPSFQWSGQPKDLSSLMQKLLEDSVLYITACDQARQRYETEFSVSAWRQNLLALRDRDAS